jgi:hypothetical protein
MRLDAAISFTDKKIAEIEQQVFVFDTVLAPRAEADKRILKDLRASRIKMMSLKQRMDALNKRRADGEVIPSEEEISVDELHASLPSAFL